MPTGAADMMMPTSVVLVVESITGTLNSDVSIGATNSEAPCSLSSVSRQSSVEITSLVADVAGEACDDDDPDAHNRGGVIAGDSVVMTWAGQPAEQTECATGIASLATPGVTASDLSMVRAVDAVPLMGSPSRIPSQATTGASTGMTSTVNMGAPAGVESGVNTGASWLGY
jgi:hypothetical protein